jgi:hypothetical protein
VVALNPDLYRAGDRSPVEGCTEPAGCTIPADLGSRYSGLTWIRLVRGSVRADLKAPSI